MTATPADLCRRLTAIGNVYADGYRAQADARLVAVLSREPAEAYCCGVCGKWHVRRAKPELRVVQHGDAL